MIITFTAERDLIRRSRMGDESAFEELVAAFTPGLFRVVHRMTVDVDRAEAVVQEAFWRVWQALGRYSEERRFFPYLVTIAANLVRDEWRRDKRSVSGDLDFLEGQPDEGPTPEALVEDAQRLRALAKAVESLPAVYRSVVALRYDAGMSYEEIASGLDLPLNTVRTALHRAKLLLRRRLEESYEGPA